MLRHRRSASTRARRIGDRVRGPGADRRRACCSRSAGSRSHPLLTNDHLDILSFWLPRFSFLGRELDAGHVPLWNPNEMMGYRFAADPQSGWLYVPPMVLFSMLSPGAAMRALIVFNPLLAGLGLFWFLRKESLSRPVATAGGLVLAMLMSTSEMAIGMPFAGFLGVDHDRARGRVRVPPADPVVAPARLARARRRSRGRRSRTRT